MRRLLLGLITIVSACSGSDTTAPALPLEPDSVLVSADASSLAAGATLPLRVVVRDTRKEGWTDRPVKFASSDENVAAVDGSGLVIGLAPGRVIITATTDGGRGEIGLLVVLPAPCPPDPLEVCNGTRTYALQLVGDQTLPVTSPFTRFGSWGFWYDGETERLTSLNLFLNADGTFVQRRWEQAASDGTAFSHVVRGRYTRLSPSVLVFVDGPFTYRGEIVGDRLQTKEAGDGMTTFTYRQSGPSAGS